MVEKIRRLELEKNQRENEAQRFQREKEESERLLREKLQRFERKKEERKRFQQSII